MSDTKVGIKLQTTNSGGEEKKGNPNKVIQLQNNVIASKSILQQHKREYLNKVFSWIKVVLQF